MTDDLKRRLRAKTLPQISGYNGDYVNEDYVLETFSEAANRIEELEAELAELKAGIAEEIAATAEEEAGEDW